MKAKTICFLYSPKDSVLAEQLLSDIRTMIQEGALEEVGDVEQADVIVPLFSPNFITSSKLMKASNYASIRKSKVTVPVHLVQCDWRDWGLAAGRPKFPTQGTIEHTDLRWAAEKLAGILLEFRCSRFREWDFKAPIVIKERIDVNVSILYTKPDKKTFLIALLESEGKYTCLQAGTASGLLVAEASYFAEYMPANAIDFAKAGPLLLEQASVVVDEAQQKLEMAKKIPNVNAELLKEVESKLAFANLLYSKVRALFVDVQAA